MINECITGTSMAMCRGDMSGFRFTFQINAPLGVVKNVYKCMYYTGNVTHLELKFLPYGYGADLREYI